MTRKSSRSALAKLAGGVGRDQGVAVPPEIEVLKSAKGRVDDALNATRPPPPPRLRWKKAIVAGWRRGSSESRPCTGRP